MSPPDHPIPARLGVVTLGAADLPALRAFYQRLGWEATSTSDEFAAFPLRGAALTLYPLDSLAEEANVPAPSGEGFKGFTCAINVEREEVVDAAIEAAEAAGARILAEPVGREWGGRSGYFADPEGNVWEIAWLPDAEFDQRGALIWPS